MAALLHLKRDPLGFMLVGLMLSTHPFIRNAKRAASMLIMEGAIYTPKELHGKLREALTLVLNQHNPPLWRPLPNPENWILWLGAERDAVISQKRARKFYGADFHLVEGSGHNLTMEKNHTETAQAIERWLTALT